MLYSSTSEKRCITKQDSFLEVLHQSEERNEIARNEMMTTMQSVSRSLENVASAMLTFFKIGRDQISNEHSFSVNSVFFIVSTKHLRWILWVALCSV